MKHTILATVFLVILAIAASVVFSQTDEPTSEAIDAAVQTEGPSIWVILLMISLGILIIVFIILYLKNQQMHKTIKGVNQKVQAYESQVTDFLSDHSKAREHLHAKTKQKHPRYHIQQNPSSHHNQEHHLRGMSHDHHTLHQLHRYIENNLRNGYSYREIRTALLQKGWTDDDILNAYKMKGFGHRKHRGAVHRHHN